MSTSCQALMVQGTTSDAGKSVLVAGICRVLAQRGVKVSPFKPQNMALNSAVTTDGGEIGRAQALQAQACGIAPSIDMNPVLIKPNSDTQAQIIINGKARHDMDARAFHEHKPKILHEVLSAFERLSANSEAVVIEGAGSPAEINLRDRDIANMGFAEVADVPVIIVADIDRGGVFAHLYGTLALLSESEQARVAGFVINRFRGDISLLQSGLDWLEETTGKPVIGVIPYLHGLNLSAEDAIDNHQEILSARPFRIRVPVLTRTSNHTDFDALRLHPAVDLQFVGKGQSLVGADLIILPGTKSVCQDLDYLRSQGWDNDIETHLRYGGKVMGICGGYQMLGRSIADPLGIEGTIEFSQGLDYLPMQTTLAAEKQLRQVDGWLTLAQQPTVPVSGYEIHAGVSVVDEDSTISAPIDLTERCDGLLSDDGKVFGTYLHGIFDTAEAADSILQWAGMPLVQPSQTDTKEYRSKNLTDSVEENLNRLAECLEQHLDWQQLKRIMTQRGGSDG